MTHQAVVIGAGFGGLACAITLASRGWKVKVLERQLTPGGKLQRIRREGYTFDRGLSSITMPRMFRSLFEKAGARMEDYIGLYELEPRSRNIFADGSVVDMSRDAEKMKDQISTFSPTDALQYESFLRECSELYQLSEEHFMNRLLSNWRENASPAMLRHFLRTRPVTSLHSLLRRYFTHPNTLAMLGRYSTVAGSSPQQSPSIFALLGHVEARMGVHGVRGGTYSMVEAMVRLALGLGVEIITGSEARHIVVRKGKVAGVEADSGFYGAETVIAAGDVLTMNQDLLDEKDRPSMPNVKIKSYEPSNSSFVLLAGVPRQYSKLLHHTIFFPECYNREFQEIFEHRQPPQHPALYVCYSGYSEKGLAPEGSSNLYISAKVPYLTPLTDWEKEAKAYGENILSDLQNYGLTNIDKYDVMSLYTPQDLATDTLAYKGAAHGISYNSLRQTFFRPGHRSKDVEGLWFVGGGGYFGGSTPLVTLAGRLVGEYIDAYKV
ncbi:phytoene desaturase family protein [Paenibacillus sp.]|jgi:phytoene desaturase|uniref:phytoene desaturase family protein n=1 Tax=Paenibacillus sp. TaxID=58172 RepID=UPI002832DE6E|nr:phytoene desaturase family protein [Paenibacillus sp.]MDR0269314.1 phytoene desaturase [Paenibacillus sp.]